jgi:hypothetical protein
MSVRWRQEVICKKKNSSRNLSFGKNKSNQNSDLERLAVTYFQPQRVKNIGLCTTYTSTKKTSALLNMRMEYGPIYYKIHAAQWKQILIRPKQILNTL